MIGGCKPPHIARRGQPLTAPALASEPLKEVMNILISTTLGHNVEDSIIAQGVKRILSHKYGPNLTYISYNRNPDLQAGPARAPRPDLVGDYMQSASLIDHVDMVVLAGSPEWYGGPLRALYEAIEARRPDMPLLALGIGLGEKDGKLTELDKKILSRPETTIITRSWETTTMLRSYAIASEARVCPALFAFDASAAKPLATVFEACDQGHYGQVLPAPDASTPASGTLQILQRPGHEWHEVKSDCLQGIMGVTHDILCLHVKEFEYYSQLGLKPLYASDPQTFASIVSKYQKVVSTRLHGAIGALSLGVPAIIIADGDFRIETCAKIFGEFLPVAKNAREALATKHFAEKEEKALALLKETQMYSYLKELR